MQWLSPLTLLRSWVDGGRLAHAYLFAGEPGMGRKQAALELARMLNCDSPGAVACGRCSVCVAIERGTDPEVRVIAPTGATMKLEQMQELCREIHLRPLPGRRRVYILEQADRLTTEAANALLAVLEEPPAHAVLVLLAVHPRALLPTLLSRCFVLSFRPWPEEVLAATLAAEGVAAGAARLAAALSQGNPGLARRFVTEGELLSGREQAESTLEMLFEDDVAAAHGIADQLDRHTRDRAGLMAFLNMFQTYLRDLLLWKVAGQEQLLINRDRLPWLQESAGRWSDRRLQAALGTAVWVQEAVRQNAQRRMCIDLLVLRLAGGGQTEVEV